MLDLPHSARFQKRYRWRRRGGATPCSLSEEEMPQHRTRFRYRSPHPILLWRQIHSGSLLDRMKWVPHQRGLVQLRSEYDWARLNSAEAVRDALRDWVANGHHTYLSSLSSSVS